jgi:sugar lactone lactonase YvrE
MTHRLRCPFTALLALCALVGANACRESRGSEPAAARMVVRMQGFGFPESVRYDPDQDVFFVSNMAGTGSDKDNNGYIQFIPASTLDSARLLVQGGVNGVTLDAPKGMALQGDTLWVADIDVLRAFHRRNGAPLGTIDLRPRGAVMLNDIATAPDGSLRVTDTGIAMTRVGVLYRGGEKVFRIGADGAVSVIARGPNLKRPNGITWDPQGKRWIIVSFDTHSSEVYALTDQGRQTVLARGLGRFDGLERLPDGRLLVTAWSDSSLHLIDAQGRSQRIVRDLWQPADIGLDTRRNRVAIPLVLQGRVEVWQLPRSE